MKYRYTVVLIILGVSLAADLLLTQPCWAENLVQSVVETRLVVMMGVEQVELQKFVPDPWQVIQMGAGPFKGANLVIVFSDWILVQDVQGKPDKGGIARKVMFTVPAKHKQSGEIASVIIHAFTADIQDVPGPYKNSVQAAIRREQTLKATNMEAGVGEDFWEVKDNRGGSIELRVQYQGAVPSRAKSELKLYSAKEPNFFRIYRIDTATDMVKSVPTGVDRLKNFQFRMAVPELSKMFDGTEQLVGVSVVPLFVRQIFLP